MDVREEILTLRRQLEHANFLYYVKGCARDQRFRV